MMGLLGRYSKMKNISKDGWIYVIPLLSLMATLIMGYSPARAAFVGMGLLIVAAMLRAPTRMSH
jgi:TRAP-type uncharacterized transport system fused permease subunit